MGTSRSAFSTTEWEKEGQKLETQASDPSSGFPDTSTSLPSRNLGWEMYELWVKTQESPLSNHAPHLVEINSEMPNPAIPQDAQESI